MSSELWIAWGKKWVSEIEILELGVVKTKL
jgi:hypothetical protein